MKADCLKLRSEWRVIPTYFELIPNIVPAGAWKSQKTGTFLNIRFWNPRLACLVSV